MESFRVIRCPTWEMSELDLAFLSVADFRALLEQPAWNVGNVHRETYPMLFARIGERIVSVSASDNVETGYIALNSPQREQTGCEIDSRCVIAPVRVPDDVALHAVTLEVNLAAAVSRHNDITSWMSWPEVLQTLRSHVLHVGQRIVLRVTLNQPDPTRPGAFRESTRVQISARVREMRHVHAGADNTFGQLTDATHITLRVGDRTVYV